MALKPDGLVIEDDISLTCESVAEAGTIVCYKTSGSGGQMGPRAGRGDVYASASGQKPVGMLYHDVANVDETRYRRNVYKDEMLVGERCRLIKKGYLTTNRITGTPTAGDAAYLTANGFVTPTISATGGLVATPKVGQFKAAKDENGFAAVELDLPQ